MAGGFNIDEMSNYDLESYLDECANHPEEQVSEIPTDDNNTTEDLGWLTETWNDSEEVRDQYDRGEEEERLVRHEDSSSYEDSNSSYNEASSPTVSRSSQPTNSGPSIFSMAWNYFFPPTPEVVEPNVSAVETESKDEPTAPEKQSPAKQQPVLTRRDWFFMTDDLMYLMPEREDQDPKDEFSAKEEKDTVVKSKPQADNQDETQENQDEQSESRLNYPTLVQIHHQKYFYANYDVVFDFSKKQVGQGWQPTMSGALGPQDLQTPMPLNSEESFAENQFLNALAKAPLVSAVITSALQVPNVLMVNTMTHGHPTKPLPTGKGIVPVIGALAKGLGPNLITGQGRGLTSATAKQTKPANPKDVKDVEVMGPEVEVPYNPYTQILHTGFFSQADLIVGQTGNIAWLRTAKNCHVPWSIHNVKEVVAVGYPIRTVTSAATFGAMCYLPGIISGVMPFESTGKGEAAANFFSGLVTAVVSTPFNMVGDTMVKNSHVDPNTGKITRMTVPEYMKMAKGVIAEKGLKSVLIDQAPVAKRMATLGGIRLGIVFATLDLAIKALPEKPLVSVAGMFGRNNPNKKAIEGPKAPQQTQEQQEERKVSKGK